MHWQTWPEKSIGDKPQISSFLPSMKMHFIFKGFSIKTEHLDFFLRSAFGLCLVSRIHNDRPEYLKCSHGPAALFIGKKSFRQNVSFGTAKNKSYFDTGEREGISWQPWLAKDVGAENLY